MCRRAAIHHKRFWRWYTAERKAINGSKQKPRGFRRQFGSHRSATCQDEEDEAWRDNTIGKPVCSVKFSMELYLKTSGGSNLFNPRIVSPLKRAQHNLILFKKTLENCCSVQHCTAEPLSSETAEASRM